MNTKTIFAGVAWGASLAAAGWVGSTYFSGINVADNQSARASSGLLVNSDKALDAAGAGMQTDEELAETKTVAPKSFFADTSKTVEERLKALLDLDDPTEKMAAFMELLPSLKSNEDYQSAVSSMMDNFDPRTRGRELSLVMTEWAKRDPLAALTAASAVKDWSGKYAASAALQTWAKTDAPAAKAWALENGKETNKDDGNYYMVAVIGGLAKSDLATAAAWAQEQPRSRARGEMMEKILDSFTKQRGTAAATEWAANLDPSVFKDGVTRRLADRLSEKDPLQAATWVSGLPSGDSKAGAMAELMDNWAEKDPNAAGLWLKKYQPSAETDEPRQTFAWNIIERDPESALAWAGTISDQKMRDRSMLDLLRDWKKRDKKGASDYMLKNNWPQESVNKVLN